MLQTERKTRQALGSFLLLASSHLSPVLPRLPHWAFPTHLSSFLNHFLLLSCSPVYSDPSPSAPSCRELLQCRLCWGPILFTFVHLPSSSIWSMWEGLGERACVRGGLGWQRVSFFCHWVTFLSWASQLNHFSLSAFYCIFIATMLTPFLAYLDTFYDFVFQVYIMCIYYVTCCSVVII